MQVLNEALGAGGGIKEEEEEVTHHTFAAKLREHRILADRQPEDVDRHLGVQLGTCENWEKGLAKPSEAIIGVVAVYLGCDPQELERMKPEVSEQLKQFASALLDLGDGVGFLRVSKYWKKAQAKRSFRGAADPGFWRDFFEGEQDPPGFDLG